MGLAMAPEIRPGDHACCVFTSDDDQAQIVGRFATDAYARGDRLFYIADRADESTVIDYLDEVGLDGKSRLDSGELQILHSSDMGLDAGFDAERLIDTWRGIVAQARSDGYEALAAPAEMTWTQTWGVPADAIVDYETAVADLFTKRELSALCQYDYRVFDPALVKSVKHVHPMAIAIRHERSKVDYNGLHLESDATAGHLTLRGEIDLANVEFLEHHLAAQLRGGDVVANCSGVTFVDVTGCRLLRRASLGAFSKGRLRLEHPSEQIVHVMTLCDWADAALPNRQRQL